MREVIGAGASGLDVRQVQEACNSVGCPVEVDGSYGPLTAAAVRCFQDKNKLVVDGKAGPITWGKMKPDYANRETEQRMRTTKFANALVDTAISYIGLREDGVNRGKQIDKWNRDMGVSLGSAWCVSCIQGIVLETAIKFGVEDPLKPETAGVLDLWKRTKKENKFGPMDGRRGDIGIMDWGGGKGHAFIVAAYVGGVYQTLEGNTNAVGGREGNGFWPKDRKYSDPKLLGFIRLTV